MLNKKYLIKIIKKNSKELVPIETEINEKGFIKNKVKCAIFDIYGTLFISGSGDISIAEKVSHINELKNILSRYGIMKDPDDVYRRYLLGIKKEHEKLKSKGIVYPEIKIEKIWRDILGVGISKARKIAVEYETVSNPVWPMPGAFDLILQLKLRRVKLGIISNAQFYTPLMFKALMGKSIEAIGFDKKLIFFSYKYKVSKPSIKLFNLALRSLSDYGISSEDTVYIGNDILNDIKPASKVGFKTVLFAGDRRSLRLRDDNEMCKDVNPDVIVTSLNSILNRINF